MAALISRKAHSNGDDDATNFLVEDVLSVAIQKITSSQTPASKAKIHPVIYEDKGLVRPDQQFPEDNLQFHIWKKLIDIDQKLNFLLEKLVTKPENGPDITPCSTWLGETGIRLITSVDLTPGDEVELRLLVPLQPPAWLTLYGMVSRVDCSESRNRDVTITFTDMDDDIRQMIRYYLLNRQREMIRRLKGFGE